MSALRVEDLNVHYGTIHAVQGVSFSVGEGEMILMPAHKPHALKAITRFKMLLIMLK